jgi:hypothetical protein
VAQEKERQEKVGLPDSTKVSTTGGPRQHAKRKKRSRMYARACRQLEELHRREGGTVSYRWDWAIRGEERTRGNGQRGSKDVTVAPWKSPMMAWSTVCDDYFRVADQSGATAWVVRIKLPRRDRERFRRGPEKSHAGQGNETVGELRRGRGRLSFLPRALSLDVKCA